MALAPGPSVAPQPPRRQAPAWLVIVLPVTLTVALGRLLIRSLARTVLALPGEWRGLRFLAQLFLGVTATAFILQLVLLYDLGWFYRDFTLRWYWQAGRFLGYPRLLDGVWASEIGNAGRAGSWSVVRPFLLVTTVWTVALFLGWIALSAVRRGFSPDGVSRLALPRPRPRRPLPFGFLANLLIVVGWGWLVAGFLLALPPLISTGPQVRYSTELLTRFWSLLRWLPNPPMLEARGNRLSAAAMTRSQDWDGQRVDLTVKFNRPLIELIWLELVTVGVGVAGVLSLVWLWRTWRVAAGQGSSVTGLEAGPRRSSPRWTVVLLPITFPLALAGLAFWKSPLWLPKLIGAAMGLYLLGFVGTLTTVLVVGYQRELTLPLEQMRELRHSWRVLEPYLPHLGWFTGWWNAIPYTSRTPPSEQDVWYAVVLLCAVVALAIPVVAAAGGMVVVLCKRILERLAR
jgi:hypothetical protein